MNPPQFHIQSDSDIPASTQLLSQLRLAIASGQYAPGSRLPSTRQLAMQTGLHRNTIAKVYAQLETEGFISPRAGSGMYVRDRPHSPSPEPKASQASAKQVLQQAIDRAITMGYSLAQVRDAFQTEIEWRSRCSASAIVVVPQSSFGTGELIAWELLQALSLPLEVVAIEQLEPVLQRNPLVTVVTSRYFVGQVEAVTAAFSMRTIAVDVYDYRAELEAIGAVAPEGCIGLVSLSPNVMHQAEVIGRSRYGDNLLFLNAHPQNLPQVRAMVKLVTTIICDRASHEVVRQVMGELERGTRKPHIVCSPNHVSERSLQMLRRELVERERDCEDDV